MRVLEFLFMLCALAISCRSHDLIVGHATTPEDSILVFTAREDHVGSPYEVTTSFIEYPGPGLKVVKANITAVYVQDNRINGTDSYPSIVAGGLGYNFVKIKLQSRVDDGFSFSIKVYGRL